jgi:hypothetical protein
MERVSRSNLQVWPSTPRESDRRGSYWGNPGHANLRPARPSLTHHDTVIYRTAKGLFDHVIGAGEQCWRHGEAERLSSREIDDEIEFGRLLDRDVGWLLPAQNLVD